MLNNYYYIKTLKLILMIMSFKIKFKIKYISDEKT